MFYSRSLVGADNLARFIQDLLLEQIIQHGFLNSFFIENLVLRLGLNIRTLLENMKITSPLSKILGMHIFKSNTRYI